MHKKSEFYDSNQTKSNNLFSPPARTLYKKMNTIYYTKYSLSTTYHSPIYKLFISYQTLTFEPILPRRNSQEICLFTGA
jgi:hypothetical protein